MSESGARFIEGSEEEARALLARPDAVGGAEELAESLMLELAGDALWRRHRVLDRLVRMPDAERLLPFFAAALHEETRADRRNGARSALTALASPESEICAVGVQTLAELVLEPKDSDVRLLAAAALGESGNPRARGALEQALKDTDVNVSSAAAESLGMIGDRRAVPALLASLETAGFWTRAAAVMALGALRDPRALDALSGVLDDPLLSAAAASAVGEIGHAASIAILARALRGNVETRSAALDSIAKISARDPEVELSAEIRREIAAAEPRLSARFANGEDFLAARLLGLACTESATDLLLEAASSDKTATAAELGLTSIPARHRLRLLLPRLTSLDPDLLPLVVGLLPAVEEATEVEAVVQLLSADSAAVRGAAGRVLGSSREEVVSGALVSALERDDTRTGAAIALSHVADDPNLFAHLLGDPEPEVRAAAADGLARCGKELPALFAALEDESHAAVRQRLLTAIGTVGGDYAVPTLRKILEGGSAAEQFSAATALGYTGSEAALEPLLGALNAGRPEIRIAAINALGQLGNKEARGALGEYLTDVESRDVRRTAARAYVRLQGGGTGIEPLAAALTDPDSEVRLTAVTALRRIGGAEALSRLEASADQERDAYVRNATTAAVVELREQLGSTGA